MSPAVLAALLAAALTQSFPPAGWRLDAYGDPLPVGAVARLGSTHLRHVGLMAWTFPPGGGTVVTVGTDHFVRTWDLATGRPLRAVPLDGVTSFASRDDGAAISADGRWVVSRREWAVAHPDRWNLGIWDASTGRRVRTFTLPETVASVAMTPDGARAHALLTDGSAFALDRDTGRGRLLLWSDKKRINGHSQVYMVPGRNLLVAGGDRYGRVDVTDLATGRYQYQLHGVQWTAASPDGSKLAVSGDRPGEPDAGLWVLDSATGKQLARYPATARTQCDWVAWSPDGGTIAGGNAARGFVLDVATGRVVRRLTGPVKRIAFSRDGRTVAAEAGPRLRLWDVATGAERLASTGGFDVESPYPAGTSPDGRFLAAPDETADVIAVWDIGTGRVVRRVPVPNLHTFRAVGFRDNGRVLVGVNHDCQCFNWVTATGQEISTVRLAGLPNQTITFPLYPRLSGDGRRFVSPDLDCPGDNNAAIVAAWDTRTGALESTQRLPPGTAAVCLAVSVDGLVAVSDSILRGKDTHGLSVVDVPTGRVRSSFPARSVHLDHVALSSDARLVCGYSSSDSGWDGPLCVRESATGKEIITLPRVEARRVAFAAGGRVLVAADRECLRAWDLATGVERVRRPYPVGRPGQHWHVHDLVVPGDGRAAVTILADGTAVVWDLTPVWPVSRKAATPAELTGWCADLGSADARIAYRAVWALTDSPSAEVVPYFRKYLRPAKPPDAALVGRLVAELDAPAFADREAAQKELGRLGAAAGPVLRRAMAGTDSAEVRQRLEAALTRVENQPLATGAVRFDRAVGVLERLGTADARKLLTELAGGAAGAPETAAAKAALGRLADAPSNP